MSDGFDSRIGMRAAISSLASLSLVHAVEHCIANGYSDAAYIYARMLARHAMTSLFSYSEVMAWQQQTGRFRPYLGARHGEHYTRMHASRRMAFTSSPYGSN
jgi:hypothetical protein